MTDTNTNNELKIEELDAVGSGTWGHVFDGINLGVAVATNPGGGIVVFAAFGVKDTFF
jgi:hypothetical protein